MRRYILLFIMVFSLSENIYAQGGGDVVISKMLAKIESMNPYKVDIEVVYGTTKIPGFYEVDKSGYYISIDEQELYGDAEVKREVFNSRKEVVVDTVAANSSGNILDNPATAFQVIRDNYTANILSENEAVIIVELKQNLSVDSGETIELNISKKSMLPKSIVYRFDDEAVQIDIIRIDSNISTITSYNDLKYADYEIIDFR